MSLPLILYVHGFNSSPASIKAQLLGDYLRQHPDLADYQVPALSHWPAEAIADLETLIQAHPHRPILLVGSSLGGFYSLWLCEKYPQCRVVLVNPAVYPYRLLADWLGETENLYTHEQYVLTREHLAQLEALAVEAVSAPERYLLLTQTGDETLDYREAVEFLPHSAHFIQTGGSHGFDQFEKLIPAIIAFASGEVQLPPATPLPFSIE